MSFYCRNANEGIAKSLYACFSQCSACSRNNDSLLKIAASGAEEGTTSPCPGVALGLLWRRLEAIARRDVAMPVEDVERAAQIVKSAHGKMERQRAIIETAGRLILAANVTPMTSTNVFGLAELGKELANLERLLREPAQ